jgi:hypothetical protein
MTTEHAELVGSAPLTIRSRSIKFTPERLQQIKNLVERGKSRDEIATILDVTVGSLQVTCSRLGISLRRPKIDNGLCLLRKRPPLFEPSHRSSDHNERVPLQPTEAQTHGNSQSQPERPAVIVKPEQQRTTIPEGGAASFAIRIQYRGMEQTHELPLTTHTIGQLALEATLREVTIGELIAAIITAIVDKDLFALMLNIASRRAGAEHRRRTL